MKSTIPKCKRTEIKTPMKIQFLSTAIVSFFLATTQLSYASRTVPYTQWPTQEDNNPSFPSITLPLIDEGDDSYEGDDSDDEFVGIPTAPNTDTEEDMELEGY